MASRKLSDGTKAYGSRWQRAAKAFLIANPCCVMCADEGKMTPATVVDHRQRHQYDVALFWDRANWQPLCQHHHNSTKQKMEARVSAMAKAAGPDGMPKDPDHPWAKAMVN